MIEIGINPNTKVASVAIILRGYFGLGKDGIKLVDQDTVFEGGTVAKAGEVPTEAFSVLKPQIQITDKKQMDRPWLFKVGQSGNPNGRPRGTTKTPLADLMKDVAESKHYTIKGTGEKIVAYDLMAEAIIDKAVKGDMKAIEFFTERTEGKVTQGVKHSGAIAQGNLSEESIKRLESIFPDLEGTLTRDEPK